MMNEDRKAGIVLIFWIMAILFFWWLFSPEASAQTFKVEGKTYTSVAETSRASKPEDTGYTWQDSKGKTYPIYIGKTGSCFILKKSSKTGKEYKQYLGSEVSEDICKKLSRTYTSKSKRQ